MKKRQHTLCQILLLLAVGLTTVACSGGGDDDNNNGGGTNTGGGTATTDADGFVCGSGSTVNTNGNAGASDKALTRLEMPQLKTASKDSSFVIVYRVDDDRTAYDADGVNFAVEWCYKNTIRSQRWSAYQLHSGYGGNYDRVTASTGTTYPFDTDNLPTGSNYYWNQDYYWSSGLQHGHICPNADRKYSYTANYQTMLLTNMQPQYGAFNGRSGSNYGLWYRMENLVRKNATKKDGDVLYVVKGGTIDKESDIIKRIQGKLVVPKYFFMALLLERTTNGKTGYRSIGWIAPQDEDYHSSDKLSKYAMSIDALEARTGIDFFCNLPDDVEKTVETQTGVLFWGFDNY